MRLLSKSRLRRCGLWVDSSSSVGLSLIEALVAIAVVGILSALAIPIYGGLREKAVSQVASETVDWLNEAVLLHSNTVGILEVEGGADDSSVNDEAGAIFELTRTTSPNGRAFDVGYPFLRPTPGVIASENISVPRYKWSGSFFESIPAGEEGFGFIIGSVDDPNAANLEE